jgi:transglutaminase-like putative cysteine protease
MLKPETENLNCYLLSDEIIDFNTLNVSELANKISANCRNDVELIEASYNYVRDKIGHSIDIKSDAVTIKASDVLNERTGLCYSKSHLLAALLRFNKIPCGFCYQILICLHGLNGVYIKNLQKWIRLDSRGNKEGVCASFSLTEEKLAFNTRKKLGEKDIFQVYYKPNRNLIKVMKKFSSVKELINFLPSDLQITL